MSCLHLCRYSYPKHVIRYNLQSTRPSHLEDQHSTEKVGDETKKEEEKEQSNKTHVVSMSSDSLRSSSSIDLKSLHCCIVVCDILQSAVTQQLSTNKYSQAGSYCRGGPTAVHPGQTAGSSEYRKLYSNYQLQLHTNREECLSLYIINGKFLLNQ